MTVMIQPQQAALHHRKEHLNGETIPDIAMLFNLAESLAQGLECEARSCAM